MKSILEKKIFEDVGINIRDVPFFFRYRKNRNYVKISACGTDICGTRNLYHGEIASIK